MKKILFLVIIPASIYAQDLKELIDLAKSQNELVAAKEFNKGSKEKELASKNSSYFPVVDVGAFYKRDDEASPFQPGDTMSAFGKISYDIYDGGKRSSSIQSAKDDIKAAGFESESTKKSIVLGVVQDFYNLKSMKASLDALSEARKSLKAQLERIQKFYEVKIATKEDVDRLRSAYDTNTYDIESLRFQLLSLKKSLELKVGSTIDSLNDSIFTKENLKDYETLDATKALVAKKDSLRESAQMVDSFYYPNIKIEDKYSVFSYNREETVPAYVTLLDNQNTLMLTVNMRLFDYGQFDKTKEAVLLQAQALNAQVAYQNKEQKINYELAKSRIEATNLKIKSAQSALVAATSAYETIEQKYNAGIVDYVVYLDALTKKTSVKALYESSLNELEIAYAIFYFYSGKNIEEFIK